ncbi:MAG: HAD hydrolase-like protein, partial [Muribaculaceae bacterium]|nr:HAD hydrolase-like protein [Muribaculaceae bacterium]
MTQFDSYIFDMDGTLWDAVDSYCAIWNATIAQMGIDVPEVTRPKLESMMGTPIDGIFDTIIGDA